MARIAAYNILNFICPNNYENKITRVTWFQFLLYVSTNEIRLAAGGRKKYSRAGRSRKQKRQIVIKKAREPGILTPGSLAVRNKKKI
jgi:hypothetical protein